MKDTKDNKFIQQETTIEFIEEIVVELYTKYKIPLIVLGSLILLVFLIPVVWSWILPFYCNDSIIWSLIELLLVVFVYGLFLPFVGNVLYVAWKLSNCNRQSD